VLKEPRKKKTRIKKKPSRMAQKKAQVARVDCTLGVRGTQQETGTILHAGRELLGHEGGTAAVEVTTKTK